MPVKTAHNYFVYIVACSDDSYYTGVINDIERRLLEHNNGASESCYTYERRPVILMYTEFFTDIKQAIVREKQLKGWSRKKKEALFREDWSELSELSKSKK